MVVLRKPVAGLAETALAKFVAKARGAAGLNGTVNVVVTSNSEMRSLNRRFRRKDKPTDVLSFPSDIDRREFAGDIAISAQIASHNARLLGHTTAIEIKILVLHGILHLRGYDHESDRGQMARMEVRLRRKLKLPIGLIERSNSSAPNNQPASLNRRRR